MITYAAQSVQSAQDGGLFSDGFGVGTILMVVGMILAVAAVSGLGFIARMNDRSAERKSADTQTGQPTGAAPDGKPDNQAE
jgi:hypothetical protein